MKEIYEDNPSLLKDKDIIDPLYEKLNGKTFHEVESIFNSILHALKMKATLKTKGQFVF